MIPKYGFVAGPCGQNAGGPQMEIPRSFQYAIYCAASFCIILLSTVVWRESKPAKRREINKNSDCITSGLYIINSMTPWWLLPPKKGEAPPDSTFRLGEVETRSEN